MVSTAARTGSDTEELALAALGVHELGQLLTDHAATDLELLLEARAAVAADRGLAGSALAARVLAALSRSKSHLLGEDRAESEHLSREAVELARTSGDDHALAFCLLARHDAIWKPGTARERQQLADEMTAAAQRASDPELEMQAALLRLVALLEQGDPRALDEHRSFVAMAERARLPRFRYYARSRQATIATLQGDFAIARDHVERARELAEDIGEVDAIGVWTDQRLEIARLQHRTDEIIAIIDTVRDPDDPHTRILDVMAALARGDLAAAVAQRHDIEAISAQWPRWAVLMWLAFRAELAIAGGDAAECSEVRAALEPFVDQWAVLGGAVVVRGPLRYWAAAVDLKLDRHDAAIAGFETALVAAASLEARPWTALTKIALAQSLVARSKPGDLDRAASLVDDAEHEATALDMAGVLESAAALRGQLDPSEHAGDPSANVAVFRRDGDVWTLVFDGRTAHVADAKGLRDLHTLLAHPGTDIPAPVLLDPSRNAEAAADAPVGIGCGARRHRASRVPSAPQPSRRPDRRRTESPRRNRGDPPRSRARRTARRAAPRDRARRTTTPARRRARARPKDRHREDPRQPAATRRTSSGARRAPPRPGIDRLVLPLRPGPDHRVDAGVADEIPCSRSPRVRGRPAVSVRG